MEITGIVLIVVQLITKLFGFLREIILSNFYGASNISDAYLIANSLPGQIFAIIGAGIVASFIPVYNGIFKKESREDADRFTSNLINIIICTSIILSIIFVIFAEPFVKIFAMGFDEETLSLAVLFTRIIVISIVFYGITCIMIPYLNIHKSFIIGSLIGLPLNVGMISGILLSKKINITYLAIGTALGYLLQMIMLIPKMKQTKYKHIRYINIRESSLKSMVVLSAPMIIGTAASQLNFLIDRTIASGIQEGAISALNYADRLNGFVLGIFVIPVITILYPKISNFALEKNYDELIKSMNKSLSSMSLLIVPIIFGGIVLSRDITSVLFVRGAFNQEALAMTTVAVKFYLIGLIGYAYREIFSRVFFSFNDTKTPVKNTFISVLVNIVLNIILSRIMGIGGLALSTSISSILSAYLMRKDLKKLISLTIDSKSLLRNIAKIFLSGITMAAVILLYREITTPQINILQLLLQIILGGVIFIFMIILLKVDELDAGKNLVFHINELITTKFLNKKI